MSETRKRVPPISMLTALKTTTKVEGEEVAHLRRVEIVNTLAVSVTFVVTPIEVRNGRPIANSLLLNLAFVSHSGVEVSPALDTPLRAIDRKVSNVSDIGQGSTHQFTNRCCFSTSPYVCAPHQD